MTTDAAAAAFADEALALGHEGVMVKAAASVYEAGRRGSSWRKVKPVRTLDLVVIAVEWGSGRRQGWRSNLWLGARSVDGDDFVMVGKTFKGLTDALLTWQTEQLRARELRREGHVVHVRPELVVEIALDGVQRSTRYAGGVALCFARVRHDRLGAGHAAVMQAFAALGAGFLLAVLWFDLMHDVVWKTDLDAVQHHDRRVTVGATPMNRLVVVAMLGLLAALVAGLRRRLRRDRRGTQRGRRPDDGLKFRPCPWPGRRRRRRRPGWWW